MNTIETLGFNDWFKDKVDLSKTSDFKIARVISVNKNSFVVSNIVSRTSGLYQDISEPLPRCDRGSPDKEFQNRLLN